MYGASELESSQQSRQPKPLRFVTNYGPPQRKRRRVAAACLTCRKRKTACSGERPRCETCVQHKTHCAGYPESGPTPQKRPGASLDAKTNDDRALQSGAHSKQIADTVQPVRHSPPAMSNPRITSNQSFPRKLYEQVTGESQPTRSEALFPGPRDRMPYFRWLGPTAIMPGYKQMVVRVRREDSGGTHSSTDSHHIRSPPPQHGATQESPGASEHTLHRSVLDAETLSYSTLPFYDTSPTQPSELIVHLAETFFVHLGCNYPFLQRDRFLRDLSEKRVDAILVDAVCALAARFSSHPTLSRNLGRSDDSTSPAEFGHGFAQRAKLALIDTFACPSVAAAQAALLLAYNEFGEQRDSGLWVYLGIAIRLAQDLGLHKVEGLKYAGIHGPTPRMVEKEAAEIRACPNLNHEYESYGIFTTPDAAYSTMSPEDRADVEERRAAEQERVDTFWAIFFLDRVVSSGTGRRSTLEDNDIELSFPSTTAIASSLEWPMPFPALIRIVHLYGRVANLLNSIKEPSDIMPDTAEQLAAMEYQVTDFYQRLSPRLHFDAFNFQHYMKTGEGTNFVLLHFWFHTLIVLLHQPTLLMTFSGPMLQLFPNSRQLSMSSAKTIADILSYSQLMDQKAALGNPFTSQPIYIAACAFMKEAVDRTASSDPQSLTSSPANAFEFDVERRSHGENTSISDRDQTSPGSAIATRAIRERPSPTETSGNRPGVAKHSLLATAANQHYQLCYKALQSLETYWAGAKYILTVLEQKYQGIGDPQLYTTEEGESAVETSSEEPAFNSPGWKTTPDWDTLMPGQDMVDLTSRLWPTNASSQTADTSHAVSSSKAIGWALTGTTNSASTNLAYHYAGGTAPNFFSNTSPSSTTQDESTPTGLDPAAIQHATQHASGSTTANNARRRGPHATNAMIHDKNGPPRRRARLRQTLPIDDLTTFCTIVPPSTSRVPADRAARFQGFTGNSVLPQMSPPSVDNLDGATSQMAAHAVIPTARYDPAAAAYFPNVNGDGGGGGIGGSRDADGDVVESMMGHDMMIASQDVDMAALRLDLLPWLGAYPRPEMLPDMYHYQSQSPHEDGAAE